VVLAQLGGASVDQLGREWRILLRSLDLAARPYALRGSVTTAMKRAGMPQLELKYLTSHSVRDILNEYVPLDPVAAMRGYFGAIRPLLDAISERARIVRLPAA
jgi:hypothetical protein